LRPFVDWIDNAGFWVSETWDIEKKEWVGAGWLKLFPEQRAIFEYCLTPDAEGKFPYTTLLFSTTKKSGKSTLAAAVAQWCAEELPPASEIFVCANTQEQGEGRVGKDLKYHIDHSGRVYLNKEGEEEDAKVTQWGIKYPNGTLIGILAQNYRSAAGSRHALVVWDELWGRETEADRKMWDELTPIPTVPVSLQFIATYAGYENDSKLLWDLYLQGVGKDEHKDGQGEPIPELEGLPCWKNGKLFTFWDHENRMPWQTQEYLDDELARNRPSAYLRFHENQWVTSHEIFIPIEWWDLAAKAYEKDAILWNDHPYRQYPVFIGIDAAVKKDSTAVVGVCYDAAEGVVVEIFRKIWQPTTGEIFSLQDTVGEFVKSVYNDFNVQKVVYDPTHMHETMSSLVKEGIPMEQYVQSPGNMIAASQAFYDLLQKGAYKTFPGEDARRHIQMAVAQETGRGFRIVKDKQKRKHPIDYAIAAAMACKASLDSGGVDVVKPIRIPSNFSDSSAWREDDQSWLPFPLQD